MGKIPLLAGLIGVYTLNMDEIFKAEVKECIKCMGFNIRKAARATAQYYDSYMKPSGLRVNQFSVLVVLALCGKQTISDLANQLVLDRTTLTRNLKPIEQQGLIRSEQGEDRRKKMIVLTSKGEKVLKKAFPLWKKAQDNLTGYLGETRTQRLLSDFSLIEKLHT